MSNLVRTIKLRDLLYLFVGSVIGSGIFIAPGLILRQVNGSVGLSVLVWIIGGALSLLGALTYAELAAAKPEAGGLYCYIRDGFGSLTAFLYGWCLFVVIASGTIAALARAFTKYLNEIVRLSDWQANAASILMIVIVTVVNVWGTRKSSNLQNVTTAIKAGLVIVLSAALLFAGHHAADIGHAMTTGLHGFSLLSSIGLAMIAALWAYEGWQFGTYSAGEVVDAERAFPKAFLLGSLFLIGLYLLAVFAYLVAIGPAAATATDAIAATAAKAVFGEWAGKFVAATILISVFSATNSVMLTAPRVFYAMAKDDLFFKKLAEVHPKFHTPAAAVISLGVLAVILTQAGKFSELIEGVIFVGWIFYGLAGAAIFPLRRKYAGRALPYRVPGYPWTPALFVLAAIAIIGNSIYRATIDPAQFRHVLAALAFLAAGVPVYFFWRLRKKTG